MSGRIAGLLVALSATLLLSPTPSRAAADRTDLAEEIRVFATCAGRMMALRDHLALFGGAGVDQAEAAREAHLDVLSALLELGPNDDTSPSRVYQWRVEARAAQSAILSQSAFGTRPAARAAASRASERHVSFCNGLILGA